MNFRRHPERAADAAKGGQDEVASLEAVEQLTDPPLLADVARNARFPFVKLAAVEKLTDPVLLAEIAQTHRNTYIRRVTIEQKLDAPIHQSLLADLARNDRASIVRLAAVEKLTVHGLLEELARTSEDPHVRELAARKLAEQPITRASRPARRVGIPVRAPGG